MITLKKVGKIIPVIGMMVGLSSVANAVDIKANLMVRGDAMRIEKDKESGDHEWSYLLNEQANQIDNPGDGVIFSLDNGIAGAQFSLWYVSAKEAGGENQWQAYFRRSFVWFKPWDCLKIRLGYVGNDKFFKERIDEWKVGSPFAIMERDWVKHQRYINCNDVEGWGFGIEYSPIENLYINAGITPGAKGSVASNNSKDTAGIYNKEGDTDTYIAPFGFGAKYYWKQFEFQASFRNGGRKFDTRDDTWSVVRLGAGISNDKTYSFIQPIFGFDYNVEDDKWELNGMCLDIYSELFLDAWKIMLHAPVTFRWTDDSNDVCYMESNLKVSYNFGSNGNIDDFAPYVQLGSNQDDAKWDKAYTTVWMLDQHFNESFNMSYKAGINFKVSAVEVDLGVKFDQYSNYHKNEYGKEYGFSVPFIIKVKNF